MGGGGGSGGRPRRRADRFVHRAAPSVGGARPGRSGVGSVSRMWSGGKHAVSRMCSHRARKDASRQRGASVAATAPRGASGGGGGGAHRPPPPTFTPAAEAAAVSKRGHGGRGTPSTTVGCWCCAAALRTPATVGTCAGELSRGGARAPRRAPHPSYTPPMRNANLKSVRQSGAAHVRARNRGARRGWREQGHAGRRWNGAKKEKQRKQKKTAQPYCRRPPPRLPPRYLPVACPRSH